MFDHLAIYLTERCNLACSYCYIKKDYRRTLTFPFLKEAVDFYRKNSSTKKNFTFLGGEPLSVYPLFMKVVDYIHKIRGADESNPRIILFTNGTLLTPRKAVELDEKGVEMIISLDGAGASNDCHRRFLKRSERSVFKSVMRNVQGFPAAILKKMEVNAVVTPQTSAALVDNVKFFYDKGFFRITPSLTVYGRWSQKHYQILESQLWQLAGFYISLFRQKKRLFKINYIESLLKGFCGQMSTCNRITLGTDGNFYLCDAFLSLSQRERLDYRIAGVKQATSAYLRDWISRCKAKAEEELKRYSPASSFLLHKKSKALYCPFGVYFYSKLNGYDPKPYLKDFYKISSLYTSVFWWVKEELKSNQDFLKMYN